MEVHARAVAAREVDAVVVLGHLGVDLGLVAEHAHRRGVVQELFGVVREEALLGILGLIALC